MLYRVKPEARRQSRSSRVLALNLVGCCLLGQAAIGAAAIPMPQPTVQKSHVDTAGLPLSFAANANNIAASDVSYFANGQSYGIALTNRGAVLALNSHNDANASATQDLLRMQLVGAQGTAEPRAEAPLRGRVNFLIGNDPSKWRTDVATFGKVRYTGVYNGVDLVYYGNQGHLEYDFAVAPGANAQAIRVQFDGAKTMHLDAHGNLKIQTRGRDVQFERPVAYQIDHGHRTSVHAAYQVADNIVRFQLGAYDHSKQLIIDPVLSYLSYLGGSATESIGGVTGYGASGVTNFTSAAAVDSTGNLYVVGSTYSTNFPTVGGIGTAPSKYNGQSKPWVFVSKIAPDGSSLIYSTYIGGTFDDYGYAIAVDATGSAYLTGYTDSGDFPATSGAYQTICAPTTSGVTGLEQQNCETPAGVNSGNQWGNAFVSKLNAAGNALVYSTFLGTGNTVGEAIAVDASGRAYVVGNSPAGYCGGGKPSYLCFPTTTSAVLADHRGWVTGAFNDSYAFVTVLNGAGSSLLYSTLYGDKDQGTSHSGFFTVGTAVAVDASGNFYLGGQTKDGQLPTTSGSLQPVPGPSNDANGDVDGIRAFVAKFSPVGGASAPTQVYGTYLGGTTAGTADFVSGLAADAAGNAFVYGWTSDKGFPVTTGAYQTTCAVGGNLLCANAVYIAKLNPSGSSLLWATLFGDSGAGDTIGGSGAIAIDAAGNAYITGVGQSLPQVNAVQHAGTAFAAKFDPTGSHLLFSTQLGGPAGSQEGSGIAVDASGNIYVAGNTNSGGLVTTAGVFQSTFGGTSGTGFNQFSGDGFVAKISQLSVAMTTTTLTASPLTTTAGINIMFTAMVAPTVGTSVATGTVTFKDGTTTLGTGTLNGAGQTTYSTTSLAVGSHTITAAYGGDAGDSASTSSAVTITINAAAPAAPTNLAATAGTTQVTLNWTASSGATSYSVYQGTAAQGEATTAVLSNVTGTSATILNLTGGTTYYFKVAAVGTGGTSAASNEASATPTAASTGGSGGGSVGGKTGGGAFGSLLLTLLGLLVGARAMSHAKALQWIARK